MRNLKELVRITNFSQCINTKDITIPEDDKKPVVVRAKRLNYLVIENYNFDELGFNIATPYIHTVIISKCKFKNLNGFPIKSCCLNLHICECNEFESFEGTFKTLYRIYFSNSVIKSLKDFPVNADMVSFENCEIHDIEGMRNSKLQSGIWYRKSDFNYMFQKFEDFKNYLKRVKKYEQNNGNS